MKNKLKKSISALAVSIVIMMVPLAQGMPPIASPGNSERTKSMPPTKLRQNRIILAENEENAAGDNARTATGIKNQESDPQSSQGTDQKEPSAGSIKAPLKPFKPSEEIAAEQAVDFPVDI